MKRQILVALVLAMFLAIPSMAVALPGLQLDISDGVYDVPSETVFSVGDVFTLYALALDDKDFDIENDYFISIAVIPQVQQPMSLGSIVFAGETINVTEDMIFGTPDMLPTHGIFPTYYAERSFRFSESDKAKPYNSEDDPGGFATADTGDDDYLYYAAFNVDVSGLDGDFEIHFDLYGYNEFRDSFKITNAPFSHDAQSDGSGGGGENPVPEPGTVVLLGLGLVGLAGYRKYKK